MKTTHVFSHLQGVVPCAIDAVNPATGRSVLNDRTLEEIQAQYPDAIMESWATYLERKSAALRSRPEEITAARFDYFLGVLPPVAWTSKGDTESFKVAERLSGLMTQICCRIGDRHFALTDSICTPHAEIVRLCEEVLALTTPDAPIARIREVPPCP